MPFLLNPGIINGNLGYLLSLRVSRKQPSDPLKTKDLRQIRRNQIPPSVKHGLADALGLIPTTGLTPDSDCLNVG